MLASRVPHALLVSGPGAVGKASLGTDLAAALLCTGATGADRPCRSCRACRMVEHGNHPDLHRLDPEGPGGQVGIGGPGRSRGVRDLVSELALLPVEGGARVAIIREAHRMNEDAQSALLKTLEEPPAETTLVLLADDEERLLPTVRSRCARVRLGSVGVREIERLLGDLGLADPPIAARLARLSAGRPGVAVAYAASPDAESTRGEIVRSLLDLLAAPRAARLRAARELLTRSTALVAHLSPPPAPPPTGSRRSTRKGGPGSGAGADVSPDSTAAPAAAPGDVPDTGVRGEEPAAAEGPSRIPASERRRALAVLLDLWCDLARDLALVEAGAVRSVRDQVLLEELEAAARELPAGAAAASIGRLVRGRELLDANVSPELLLDVLLLAWPHRTAAA
jgi:DNA polymerase III delta' subunit